MVDVRARRQIPAHTGGGWEHRTMTGENVKEEYKKNQIPQ
jgi:hypothetical protein